MKEIEIEALTVGPLEVNCYIVSDPENKQALLVDPGDEAQRIMERLHALDLQPAAVLLTHAHMDHWAALSTILKTIRIPVFLHEDDRFLFGHEVNNNLATMLGWESIIPDTLPLVPGGCFLAGFEFEVIHTPGHSPGSVVIRFGGDLLTGDTLFAGGIGRSDLAGGDGKTLFHSLQLLKKMPPETRIYPGHGETSDLSREARFNPFW